MYSFPPRHLCIAGALWIAMGAGSLAEMTAKLIDGRYSFDIGFVLIIIGYGLLIGNASARKWALFLASAGLAYNAGSGGCAAYAQWQGDGRWPLSPDRVCAVAEWIFGMAFCLYMVIVLTRSGHREWFVAAKEYRPAVKSLAWAAAVVGVVFGFAQSVDEWRVRETYEKASPFRVRLSPYNAENGQKLTTLSYRSDAVTHSNDSKVNETYIGGEDGPHFEFYGETARPFEVTLKSEGFEDKTLTLSGKSEFEIRVPMQPLVPGNPEPHASGEPAATRTGSD